MVSGDLGAVFAYSPVVEGSREYVRLALESLSLITALSIVIYSAVGYVEWGLGDLTATKRINVV